MLNTVFSPPSATTTTFDYTLLLLLVQLQEPLYIINSGLVRLQNGHQDMYIAGTQAERGYIRGMSSIYQPDSLVDAAAAAISLIEGEVFDCIEVDTGI